MIPLTTDVRIKGGAPRAVTGIILGTFLLHVAVEGLIQFGVVDRQFRSYSMTFDLANPDPVDWLLSIFSHGSYLHWFGNMVFLWIFGSILEDRLGSWKFLLLFLFCGLAADALEAAVYGLSLYALKMPISDFHYKTLGASGAISGIMGLSMFRFYKAKVLILVSFTMAFWKRLSIPIWLFCAYDILRDCIGIFSSDNVAHLAHIGGFFGGLAAGRFLGLKKESEEEILLENAVLLREAKMFGPAAEGFERVLAAKPGNAFARQELGFCYWGLHNPRRGSDAFLEKSRAQFEAALELYLKEGKFREAALLFERLMRLFTPKDFPEKIPLLLKAHRADDGLSKMVLTSDPAERRKILEENFKGEYHRGVYQTAYQTLRDLAPLVEAGEMAPALLEAAGEVCVRVKDQGGIERYFQPLAQKGDPRQTVRALVVLSRVWLQTPRQLQLGVLYKNAGERLLDLDFFDEWVELGKALKR